jgi:hypothetical protein
VDQHCGTVPLLKSRFLERLYPVTPVVRLPPPKPPTDAELRDLLGKTVKEGFHQDAPEPPVMAELAVDPDSIHEMAAFTVSKADHQREVEIHLTLGDLRALGRKRGRHAAITGVKGGNATGADRNEQAFHLKVEL